jgi:hypothetical protein
MRHLLTCDVRSWLTPEEYLAALHAAGDGDRTLSGYIRHLIRLDLALKASSIARRCARDDLGTPQDVEGHNG